MRLLRSPLTIAVGAVALALWGCASSPEQTAVGTLRDGVLAAREGRYDEAVALLERAHEERPGFIDPLMFLGNVHERRGDPAAAREAYRRVLATDPSLSEAAVALALTFVQEGRPDDARDWLQRALQADPGFAPTHFNLGVLAESEGRLAEAAEWYRLAATLDVTASRPLVRLGRLHLAAGRPDDARACAESALTRHPDDPEAKALAEAAAAERR